MSRGIRETQEQSLYGQPQVSFRPNDFDSVIWSHGYDVICEQAIRCPCQGSAGSPMPDCQNCHGFGYFFINPTRTKALVTGLNRSTQFTQWSPELMGTASISARDQDKHLIGYFNRVTIEDEYASFTEMMKVREISPNNYTIFTSYAPIEIISGWIYNGPDSPLIKLEKEQLTMNPNSPYSIIVAHEDIEEGVGVSLVYNHRVEYHVIDMPHEIRSSLQREKSTGRFSIIRMPVQSIMRRTHLINVSKSDYNGSGIIYNDDTD